MARKMVLVTADGSSPILTEDKAHNELQLQKQLVETPGLIPIEEFGWDGPLMVIGRETQLASGAVDLIGVARSGEILIAEFKTGPKNPDFRHALAQAIDYGADIWQMDLSTFEASVALSYFKSAHCPIDAPAKQATSLVAAADATWPDWSDEERTQFLARVTKALETGAFHFAVVAQRFTPPMIDSARYLNEIGGRASFYLVELIRFTDGSTDAFEARTVLKPSPSASSSKGAIEHHDRQSFLDVESDEDRRELLGGLFDYLDALGFSIFWGTTGVSIKLSAGEGGGNLSVGWIHPTGVTGWMGLTDLTLGVDVSSATKFPLLAEALQRYTTDAASIRGGEPAKAKSLDATIFDTDATAANLDQIKRCLAELAAAASAI